MKVRRHFKTYACQYRFLFYVFIEYLSIDGAMRVISDDFSISLLNPDSELYRYKADKYASMVRLLSIYLFPELFSEITDRGNNIT